MDTRALFLRGVSVGGRNGLPMADLRACPGDIGLSQVCTLIQSGDAVFRAPPEAPGPLARRIEEAIADRIGLHPDAVLPTPGYLSCVISDTPFPDAGPRRSGSNSSRDHPIPGQPCSRRSPHLAPRVACLHPPAGIGHSKLASRPEKILALPATALDLRTLGAVADLVGPAQ